MKYVFLVQGEGRGHMTQAIVLSRILNRNGHEVVHTFIGKSKRRSVPNYFYENIESKVSQIESPNFILDKENKSLKLGRSITHNVRSLGTYKRSLDQIHKKVKETQPDALINFYDFLGGFYFNFYRPSKTKHICVGRQFLTFHPKYPFEADREVEKKLFLTNNKITSQKCDKYLALSFRPYNPTKYKNIIVAPPLLKEDIKLSNSINEDFILGYMVNDGYAEEIMAWHKQNRSIKLHCFWDRKKFDEAYYPHENLCFHQINNSLFSDMMRRCTGYVTTAGFESICEAMYLKKPVLLIPVEGQYEQACNAIDAEISGAGIKNSSFNISKLLEFMPIYCPRNDFKNWVDQAERIFIGELTNF